VQKLPCVFADYAKIKNFHLSEQAQICAAKRPVSMFSQSWKSSLETPADYDGIVFFGPENKPRIKMSSCGLMVGGAFSGGFALDLILGRLR
jgi:hypothetical protein